MIDFYGWNTSNGRKVAILLEELNRPYRYHPVDITQGEQHQAWFTELNPNGKIPVIVDTNLAGDKHQVVFESGAILIYLAEQAASELYPTERQQRIKVMEWLMFQMGGIGPSFGQALHFYKYASEKHPYSIERYMGELHRLFGVMEQHLSTHAYFADQYSIADIATYPWVARHEWYDLDWTHYPSVERWYRTISDRPAVKRALARLGS